MEKKESEKRGDKYVSYWEKPQLSPHEKLEKLFSSIKNLMDAKVEYVKREIEERLPARDGLLGRLEPDQEKVEKAEKELRDILGQLSCYYSGNSEPPSSPPKDYHNW